MSVKRVLIGAPVLPEFDRECGSRRIFDLIVLLQEAGWAVSFVAENGRGGERYAHLLQQRGVAVYNEFGERIERLLTRGRFDLAIFAFWHLAEAQMSAVRRLSPETRVLVDSIDLHFVRNARQLFQAARARPTDAAEAAVTALDANYGSKMIRELNVYAAADGVLTVSQKEADLLTDLIGDPTLAHVVPLAEDLLPSPIPLEQRKGVLFLGNFRHSPNVDAVDYLCNEILPLIDPTLLVEHPVSIVGNALNDSVRSYGRHLDHVNMIGWVPSVLPYLHRTRVMAVPLRYGAGTKGKIVQSLMAGTPTVSTTIGIEGLHLRDGQEVLVADDPRTFASGISRLLRDERLCELLSRQGREHMTARHGRDVVRQRLLDAITMVLVKPARRGAPLAPSQVSDVVGQEQYREMVARVRHAVAEVVPEGATIAVTSRGDEELLKIPARRGWHFPQDDRGIYAGHYPRDGAAAVEHLEALRKKGAGFLVFPETARWWLNHYDELKRHLELYSRQVLRREGDCIIFDLREPVQPVPATVLRSAAECSTRGE